MADNTIANAIKFLKGEEKSLPATKTEGQVYFAYKNVGTAEKPSYTGAIYIDTPIGGTQNRIKMTANADIADKAFNDSAGLNIRDTYLSSLGYTDDGKQIILIKGSGNNQTRIALPIASTTKSGIVTTDTQSFGGTKTFTTINSTNLIVTGSNGFNYSSIGAGTVDVARPIWFADNSGNGKPVVNTNFTYNPATQTLKVANLSGTADKANKDSAGNDIRNTYISNITVNGTTLTFTKGGGATSSITLQDTNNAVTQTAIKSSDYTNWRTVLWGASNSATEGFTPTTVTDCAFTSDTLIFQPSSGTLKAKIFKGSLSGNASTATSATKATYDSSGTKDIRSYVSDITISGRTITVTKGSGAQVTLTTQDTDTWRGIQNNLTSDSTTDSLSAAQGKYLKSLIDGKSNNGHNHDDRYYTEAEINSKLTNYLPLTGGTLTGKLIINGDAAHQPLVVRDIVGSDGTGIVDTLYLQYGANKPIVLGNTGSYNISADGSKYSGNAATATKLTTAKTLWGQSFDGSGNVSGQISGCTRVMNANNNSLYLGNYDNTGFVYTQDICSQSGQDKWTIRQNGLGIFKNIGIGYNYNDTDTSYALKVKGNTYHSGKVYFANDTTHYDTTYYINESADANLRAVGTSDKTYIAFPQGGGYRTATSSITGYLKITLPRTWSNTMMSFKVTIYELEDNLSCTYYLSGYNYADSGGTWACTSAYSLSKSNSRTISDRTVRFGHDGSKCAIYIGENNSSWHYPQIQISDITVGFMNYDYTKWASGWSVGFTATLGTITSTITKPCISNSAATLEANAGSATKPVYFSGGVPVQCNDTLANNISGNASTATKLQTARSINGTNFDGTGNITTTNWGTSRTITIGGTSKSVNGGSNVSWSLSEIGASAIGHTHTSIIDSGNNSSSVTFSYSKADLGYSAYTWLAAWNGTELRAVNKNQFATSGHIHNYAGSTSAGGSANSAVKLDTATAGSATQPVYFSGGKPVACTYTLGKSVPSNAVFTDTNTWRPLGTTADTACAGNDSRLSNARPASDVYSWAKASTKPVYTWGEINGKPSTFTPSDHTHNKIMRADHLDTIDKLNAFKEANAFKYATVAPLDGLNGLAKNDGIILSMTWKDSTGYGQQIFIDNSGPTIAHRYNSNNNWSEWIHVLDSANYTEYTVTKSGLGASGTWGINVTGSAGSVAWGNVSGRPSSMPASDVYSWAKASSKPSYNWDEITNKPSSFNPSSHTHPYLPLSGGTMTGTINFTVNQLACNFRPDASGYCTGIMHQTSGDEALMFAAANAVTSFIFKCGQNPVGMTSTTWTGITPSMQIKKQSVYINSLIANNVPPSYNLYVNGTTRCNGTLGVGNGSSAEIDFFPNSSSTIGAKIVAYNDRIEFVFG